MKRIPLLISVVLFILLCVTSSYWVMRLIKPEARKISVPPINKPFADVESVASLFGGMMLVDTSYQLKGIVQANPMRNSVAIIAVDGQPPQAYPMYKELISGSSLNEVYSQYVLLLHNGVTKRVELPQDTSMSYITEVTSPVANRRSETEAHMSMGRSRKLPPSPPPIRSVH